MLTHLNIKNIGLISTCDIELKNGLTVITGETGAGKSMLMDALSLALGSRSDSSLIRHGSEAAFVEATFDVVKDSPLFNKLEEMDIELDDGDVTFRRTISADKSKGFVNGVRVTQSQMKLLGDALVDIHGQYDHQLILKPTKHGEMLDHFGKLEKERSAVKKSYKAWKKSYDELNEARMLARSRQDEEYLTRGYLEELENLTPQVGEEAELTAERKRLMGGEKMVEAFNHAMQSLENVSDCFNQAEGHLSPVLEAGGEELDELYSRLSSVGIEASDVIADIERFGNAFEPDPERLAEVDERLFALKDCARKHHTDVDDLPEVMKSLSEKMEMLSNISENIQHLEEKAENDRSAFLGDSKKLSKSRAVTSKRLSSDIESALKNLEMPNTKFAVDLEELPEENWTSEGAEKVEFMVATNVGSPLQPLVKVASGGEVSRLMLALKKVFYTAMPRTTLVFDEVDTGVGGSVADSMGQVMRELSENHQVFSITHLPQVAAKGHTHIKIQKGEMEGETHTKLSTLSLENREQELARMLAGKEITAEATAAAKSLLSA